MHRHLVSLTSILLVIVLLSACNHIPDHARLIPKDAVAVAGINLKSLSKKIAWNVITGSKLFKEMQSRIPEKNAKDAMGGIEKAGLDVGNTIYVYVKPDVRFKGSNRVTALVPLADAGQWETYVKTAFPGVDIKDLKDRKEASLSREMYVGWKKNLLIILNVMPATPDYASMAMGGSPGVSPDKTVADPAAISAEMENAFNVTGENAITNNKHFTSLETEGHDVTFWLNYEQLMSQMSGSVAEKMGMALSADLWKDAAFAAGFDFKKGRISSDMRYFVGPGLKDIGAELGGANADPDMISRLPAGNMDMLVAIHISPKAIRDLLEKMNLLGLANLGLANLGLSAQNMTVDYVLDAFTGDMAFVMNDFSLGSEKVTDTFNREPVVHREQKPSLTASSVIKINKKENFQKLVNMAQEMGLHKAGNGFVVPIDDKDSVYVQMNDQYLVWSNKIGNVNGILHGDFKSQKMPDNVSSTVNGHTFAFYFDIQQFCKNIDNSIAHSPRDSFMISESKKLLSNISFTGGAYRNNALECHLDVNFMNTEENSIIELMDYSMKMNDAGKLNQ